MGHHFDSPESRADSRINIADNYLFEGDPGRVIAIMTVSPLAGLPSPYHGRPQALSFRPGCAYDFRFDTDGDLMVDEIVRLVFTGEDAPQAVEVRRLNGAEARDHHGVGRSIGRGTVETTFDAGEGIRAWVGLAGDPFWLDAVATRGCIDALLAGGGFAPDSFSTGNVTTGATNVLAIVLDLPRAFFPGPVNFYTTVSADDHGHWTQVQRCGRPNFAATFIDDPERSLKYNQTDPDTDLATFGAYVETLVTRLTTAAGTAANPAGHARLAARALLPDVIPYDPDLPAGFGFAGINGRGLADDFGAVVYSQVFNFPMRTAVPPLADLRAGWPYVSPPRPLPAGPGVAVPDRNEG